jgi:hypothetical protein
MAYAVLAAALASSPTRIAGNGKFSSGTVIDDTVVFTKVPNG